MSNTMYTLNSALQEVKAAHAANESSITLYGIHDRCAERVVELFSESIELKTFKNNSTGQPSATFCFKTA